MPPNTPRKKTALGTIEYDKDAEYLTTVSTTEDFMDAVKNASESETIQLTQDIKINDIIPQSQAGDTRIDLNGKTLSMEFDKYYKCGWPKCCLLYSGH